MQRKVRQMSDLGAVMDLFESIRKNDIDQVKKLISSGIDLDMRNGGGQTALHIASLYNRSTIAELLICAGANVNAKDREGETALHLASVNRSIDVLKVFLTVKPLFLSDGEEEESDE